MAEAFYCSYKVPVTVVRPFNTFGPRQSGRAVIPAIVTQALAGERIRLGNLNTSRDFTYVADTVRGFLLAAERGGLEGQVFNLGTGQEISIEALAQKIVQKIGRPVEIVLDPNRLRPKDSEVLQLVSDNSLAVRKLGWRPEYTLDDGLDRTIEWIRGHLEMYRIGEYEF